MTYLYGFYRRSEEPVQFSGVFSAPTDEILFASFANNFIIRDGYKNVYIDEFAIRSQPLFRLGMMNSDNGVIEPCEPIDITESFIVFLDEWLKQHSVKVYELKQEAPSVAQS